MREIKFRAWDIRAKEMFNVAQICYDTKGNPYAYAPKEQSPRAETELMQYTGLKDKNGKEIYEGNLIGYKGGGKGLIVYENGCPTVQEAVHRISCCCLFEDNEECEVIGNIYENPELLKEKKP